MSLSGKSVGYVFAQTQSEWGVYKTGNYPQPAATCRNQLQPPATSCNHPQPARNHPQPPATSQEPARTTQNQPVSPRNKPEPAIFTQFQAIKSLYSKLYWIYDLPCRFQCLIEEPQNESNIFRFLCAIDWLTVLSFVRALNVVHSPLLSFSWVSRYSLIGFCWNTIFLFMSIFFLTLYIVRPLANTCTLLIGCI